MAGPVRAAFPIAPLLLGAGGLIPFVAGAGLYAVSPAGGGSPALLALTAYAAAILSFLGGVRWGAEIARADPPSAFQLVASVVPALIGWAMLLLTAF